MRKFFLISVFLFLNHSCYCQYEFRNSIPVSELTLDTPYIFKNLNDFFEIKIDENGNQDTITRCSVNAKGQEVFRISTDGPSDKSLYYKSTRKYDDTGKLISSESYYPGMEMYVKDIYTYNDKNNIIKVENFVYESVKIYDSKINGNTFSGFSLNDEKKPDSTYFAWKESNIFILKYNTDGRINENYHGDEFYQSEREVSVYNTNGKLSTKEYYKGWKNIPVSRDKEPIVPIQMDTLNSFREELIQRDTVLYFRGGYIIKNQIKDENNQVYFTPIDSIFIDSKDRIIAKKWILAEVRDVSKTEFGEMKTEFDIYGRKSMITYNYGGNKIIYKYFYKKPSKIDLVRDGF